jgi:hypothetical protein
MLRLLLKALHAKNADRTEAGRLSVVRLLDQSPQSSAPAEPKKQFPKSVCTSLKDLCEL